MRFKAKDYNGITPIPHAPAANWSICVMQMNGWDTGADVLGCVEVNDILRDLFGALVEWGVFWQISILAAVLKELKDECRK